VHRQRHQRVLLLLRQQRYRRRRLLNQQRSRLLQPHLQSRVRHLRLTHQPHPIIPATLPHRTRTLSLRQPTHTRTHIPIPGRVNPGRHKHGLNRGRLSRGPLKRGPHPLPPPLHSHGVNGRTPTPPPAAVATGEAVGATVAVPGVDGEVGLKAPFP
jgi:hypothetical protein